jgi:hypothetical protein
MLLLKKARCLFLDEIIPIASTTFYKQKHEYKKMKRIEKMKAPFVIVCQYLIPEIKTMGLDAESPDIRWAKSPT